MFWSQALLSGFVLLPVGVRLSHLGKEAVESSSVLLLVQKVGLGKPFGFLLCSVLFCFVFAFSLPAVQGARDESSLEDMLL